MSNVTEVDNTGQQAHFQTDTTKIFIGENRYEQAEYVNSAYLPDTLSAGRLMGRVAATQKVVPLDADATDGSQFPVGVLADDYTIEEGATKTVTLCVAGDVAEEKVTFSGAETMNTIVSSRTLRDRIAADTLGIKLVSCDSLTGFDNE